MDRAMLLDHLSLAERHVAEGAARIERQRQLIARLEADGHNGAAARHLLRQFEEVQEMHISDRERVRKELSRFAT